MSKDYYRKFITLEMEGRDKQKAFGSAIIEGRNGAGKISVNVENIRPSIDYTVELVKVFGNRSEGISLGNMISNGKGHGNFKVDVDCLNVLNSNISLDDFDVVSIKIKNTTELITPLVGYYGEKVNWKSGYININKKNEIHSNREKDMTGNHKKNGSESSCKEESLKKDSIKDNSKPEVEDTKNHNKNEHKNIYNEKPKIERKSFLENEKPIDINIKNQEKNPYNNSEEKTSTLFDDNENENIDKKVADLENKKNIEEKAKSDCGFGDSKTFEKEKYKSVEELLGEYRSNDFDENNLKEEDVFIAMVEKLKNELKELKNISENDVEENDLKKSVYTSGEIIDFTQIFEASKEHTPFLKQNKDVYWIEIELDKLAILPGECYRLIRHKFLRDSYKKFGKLILGRYFEQGRQVLLLGVPDYFEEDKERSIRQMGFIQFKIVGNTILDDGAFGYWIKIINRINPN